MYLCEDFRFTWEKNDENLIGYLMKIRINDI